jgi:hypothetical protein
LGLREALAHLDDLTQKSVRDNVAELKEHQYGNPMRQEALDYLDGFQKLYEKGLPGGFSFSDDELRYVYDKMGKMTYEEVVQNFAGNIFPRFFQEPSGRRAPGCIVVGYLLDLCEIVDPEIATYEERVAVTAKALRKARFDNFDLGTSFDDAVHLRGTADHPYEFIMDKKLVSKYKDQYLSNLNTQEAKRFRDGYTADLDDLINHETVDLN